MNRSTRIRRIVELKALHEKLAVRAMNEARQKLAASRQLHAQLNAYGDHYQQLEGQLAEQRVAASRWTQHREFSGNLKQAIEQQCLQLDLDQQALAHCDDEWHQLHAKTLASKSLLERIESNEHTDQQRAENREADDRGTARFRLQRGLFA